MNAKAAVAGGLLVVAGLALLWLLSSEEPPPASAVAPPSVEVPRSEPPQAAAPEPSPQVGLSDPQPEAAVASPASLSPRDRIQARLNALAAAYNAADAAAAEAALDENHAVIRPDGRTLYASDTLGQWAIEWSQLSDRTLTMQLESLTQDGDLLTATWTVDLKAKVFGEDGVQHDFEFGGTQVAIYRQIDDRLVLEEPIRYAYAYQTIDGHTVNPYQ